MEITQDINEICAELLNRYKEEIKKSGHNASGLLVDTATYTTTFNGKWFELYFNLQDYWKYLENGTSPHFPPIDKIEEWVRIKPIVPIAVNSNVPTTRQVAYLIARKISVEGTKPLKLLDNALNNSGDLLNKLAEEFEKQLQEEINEEEI